MWENRVCPPEPTVNGPIDWNRSFKSSQRTKYLLQKLIGELATENRRGFDRVHTQFEEVAKRMRETDERMRETAQRMRETDERMRQTDARIDKLALEDNERRRYFDQRVDNLVIAVGELIRRQNGTAT